MPVDLDIVIETPEHSVDMKSGLDTLQGTSEVTRYIAEALLTNHVPKRLSHTSSIRTSLKQSFKGSYGHKYCLEIVDKELKTRFDFMGKHIFLELVTHFISEALFLKPNQLTPRAEVFLDALGDKADDLISQLRKSSLKKAHEVSQKFGYDVKIKYGKDRQNQTTLIKLDQDTALALYLLKPKPEIEIEASITRLNINTGNGRLCVKGEKETLPFGFSLKYKDQKMATKKLFSQNLDVNNGLNSDNWTNITLSVIPMKLKSGAVVKYMIKTVKGVI